MGERLLLVAFIVAYGAVGIDLLHSSVRTGVLENPYAEYFNRLRYLAIAVSLFLFLRMPSPSQHRVVRNGLPFLPLLIVASLTIFTTEETFGVARYVGLLGGFILGLCVIRVRLGLEGMLQTMMHFLALILISSCVLAIVFPGFGRHSGLDMLELGHVGRWRGIFGHKNALGGFAAIGCPLFWFYGRLMQAPSLYLWAARLAALSCLLLSGSSNSLAGSFSIAAASLLLSQMRFFKPSVIIACAAVCILLLMPVVDIIAINFLDRDDTFSGRTIIWEAVLALWQQKPLLGYGYGAGADSVRPLLTSMLFASAVDAHNGYLDIMIEIGVIGLAAFLFVFGVTFRHAFRVMENENAESLAVRAASAIAIGACIMAIGEVAPFRIVGGIGWSTYLCLVALLGASSAQRAVP